jgi:transposase
MNKRLYPTSEAAFNEAVLPVMEGNCIGKGRPSKVPHYKAFCGILYIMRTGALWRDLPEEYGHWHVVYDRFSRGSGRGLWAKVLSTLQERTGIRFEAVIIDSTTMKTRRHGGRAKKGQQTKGKSRAGISTKFHLAITGLGQIVEGFLSGGEASDVKAGPELTKDIVGCPVIADRGYDSDKFRMYLRGNSNIPVIPGRKNRKEEIEHDRQLYKKRGLIERIFGKVKENRRLAVRYEKPDVNFLGFIIFAFIKFNLC